MYVKKLASYAVQDPVAAMQAKYPQLKECAALVKLGLTAADTVRVMHSTGLYYHIAWTLVVPIGRLDVICAHHIV